MRKSQIDKVLAQLIAERDALNLVIEKLVKADNLKAPTRKPRAVEKTA